MPHSMEAVEQPLYDTADLGRMGCVVPMFVHPLGATDHSIWRDPRIKCWMETNMQQCGAIESPSMFFLRDITALLYDKDGPLPVFDRGGMGNLWAKTYLELSIGMKIFWQGPLALVADPVCQMGGLSALVAMKDADIGHTLRLLSYQRAHTLDLEIRQQEHFTVRVTPYTPVCRQVTVRVVLNGRKLRAVL